MPSACVLRLGEMREALDVPGRWWPLWRSEEPMGPSEETGTRSSIGAKPSMSLPSPPAPAPGGAWWSAVGREAPAEPPPSSTPWAEDMLLECGRSIGRGACIGALETEGIAPGSRSGKRKGTALAENGLNMEFEDVLFPRLGIVGSGAPHTSDERPPLSE